MADSILPHPAAVVDALMWLRMGAPAASTAHPARPAVKTLLALLDALPSRLPVYCFGSDEWKEAMTSKTERS